MKYIDSLVQSFEDSANAERAKGMENYMRNKFTFLGIDTQTRRDLQRSFYKKHGYPDVKDLFSVVFELWEMPYREYQMTAIELLKKFTKKLGEDAIAHIEKLIVTKSWWDSVDGLAAWIAGDYFRKFPDNIKPVTAKWIASENLWLQRTALLFQLKYKADTDTDLLGKYIFALKDHKDFFIRKAIGWILREFSKTNPVWVRTYLAHNQLSALSIKEGKKYIREY